MLYPIALPLSAMCVCSNAQGLNISAIAVENGVSVFQCWSLHDSPFIAASAMNYAIGDYTDSFIGVIPPKTYVGQAYAPYIQYSIVLTGLVHITLPNSTLPANESELYLQPGIKSGIIIVTDMKNVSISGHVTNFPGDETTAIAQFPILGGMIPEHTVIHNGGCVLEDGQGL